MKIPEILIVETVHQPGSLASVLQVIADAGLTIDHLQALRREQGRTLWEITLEMDEEADRSLYGRIDALPVARFVGKSDRVFDRHRGGKMRTASAIPITTQQVLRDIYTPGVARVCLAIQKDPALAYEYTSLGNSVAIVTNGTAVLGLGNIGALASLPVMEGKAALFSTLVGINAVPILLDEKDPARCIDHIASDRRGLRRDPARGFRGTRLLRDRAGPACAPRPAGAARRSARNRGRRARRRAERHAPGGNGARRLDRRPDRARRRRHRHRRLLQQAGARRVLGTDLDAGAMRRLACAWAASPRRSTEIMKKADIVIATTGVRGLDRARTSVRKGQIILALSNPDPEIEPSDALAHGAAIAADGKGINNLLAFPGLFKGALAARATRFTDAMLLAAAGAIAELARGDDLVPDPLDREVHQAVAAAVSRSSQPAAS